MNAQLSESCIIDEQHKQRYKVSYRKRSGARIVTTTKQFTYKPHLRSKPAALALIQAFIRELVAGTADTSTRSEWRGDASKRQTTRKSTKRRTEKSAQRAERVKKRTKKHIIKIPKAIVEKHQRMI